LTIHDIANQNYNITGRASHRCFESHGNTDAFEAEIPGIVHHLGDYQAESLAFA
jgi:hypothetical protein